MERTIDSAEMEITGVVSGGADGVDLLGERWAESHGIPVKQFLPDWECHGATAGRLRNIQMAHYADALIAIWDGVSRGTKHMINTANYNQLPTLVVHVPAGRE